MKTTAGLDQLLDQMDGLFAGLYTAVSNLRAGTATEATYTGYNAAARPAVTFGAQAATTPAGGRQVANSALFSFPENSGALQTIRAIGLVTASSGGTIRELQYLSPIAPFMSIFRDATGEDWVAPAHGLAAGQLVRIMASGIALPTGFAEDTDYYVIAAGLTTDQFRLSATFGGSAVNGTALGAATIMPITPVDVATLASPQFIIDALRISQY